MRAMLLAGMAILGLIGQAKAGAIEIIATIPAFDADVQAKLAATGRFSAVDVFDASSATPDAANLADYSAVLVYGDASFADATTLGNLLDAYLRGGGGVVTAIFSTTDGGTGLAASAFANDFTIDPSGAQGSNSTPTLGTINDPGNPLVAGVTGFNGGTGGFYNTVGALEPGAIDVADYANGTPLIASRIVGGYETVGLNFYPPSSDADPRFQIASDGGTTILADALSTVGAQSVVAIAVSEPASIALLGLALAGVIILRRQPSRTVQQAVLS